MERGVRREVFFVLLAAAVTGLLNLTTWLPLVFVLPALVAFNVAGPLFYLGILALISELYATTPFGIMTVIVFTPWLVKYLTKKDIVDFSVYFLFTIVIIVVLQSVILFGPNLWAEGLRNAPWSLWPRLAVVAGVVWGATVVIHFNRTW